MTSKTMPSRAAVASSTSKLSPPPNQSLYCSNLPDKLHKDDLRLSLYTLFSTYGPVLDVVALKTMKMRGQAHIVFRDIQASTQAMRALQGFVFFGKEMKIQYAKSKSDTLAKLDGTFRVPTEQVAVTELQQSIFNAPPSSSNLPQGTGAPSLKPPEGTGAGKLPEEGAKSPQGVKRRRDEESDDEEALMDEDDDGDAPMEDSSDED